MVKKVVFLMVILLHLCIVGCNLEKNVINDVDEEKYDLVDSHKKEDVKEVELLIRNDVDLELHFSALEYLNQHYLASDDFIEIVNLINESAKILELHSTKYYDGYLDFTLRHDINSNALMIQNMVDAMPYKVQEYKPRGTPLNIVLELDKTLLGDITIDGITYIPLDIINTNIFRENARIIREKHSEYRLINSLSLKLWQEIISNLKLEIFDDDFNRSYLSLFSFFEETTELNILGETVICNDYPAFVANLYDAKKYLKDYHYNILGYHPLQKEQFTDQELLKINNAYYHPTVDEKIRIAKMVNDEEPIVWESLNSNTLYLRVNTFGIDPILFASKINQMQAEMSEQNYSKLVIDIRDNLGGYTDNGSLLLKILTPKSLEINIGQMYNNEVFSTIKYCLERTNNNVRDYDIVLILNENCSSNAVFIPSIIKDNFSVEIIGREPKDKKTDAVSFYQTLDGTIITKSQAAYCYLTKDNIRYNDLKLVNREMTDEEIEDYLSNLRFEE